MSTPAWIVLGGFELALLLGIVKAVRLWRDETDTFDEQPLGDARSYPFKMFCGAVTVGLVLLLAAIGTEGASPAVAILALACLVVAGAGFALARSVARRGRPQALVPPHLRGIDGPPDRPVRRGRLRDAG